MSTQTQVGITQQEFEQLMRMAETDPEEAIKRWFNKVGEVGKKKALDYKRLDKREYGLLVHLSESNNYLGTAQFLLSLLNFRYSADDNGRIAHMQLFRPDALEKPQFQLNVWVKFKNVCRYILIPIPSCNRLSGEYPLIDPGDVYEGPVYLKYLNTWLTKARIKLLPID